MNMDLAKRLVELRLYNDMTQDELAVKAGINKKEIEKWERGNDSPDGAQLIKLSQVYKIPIDEILLNFDTDGDYHDVHELVEVTPASANGNAAAIPTKKRSYNWYAFPYPIVVTAVYLCLGFFLNSWHPTWLVFLTIPIYYILLAMNDATGFAEKAYIFPYPIIILILYLAYGFDYGVWHPTWMVFLTIPVYYMTIAWLDNNGK